MAPSRLLRATNGFLMILLLLVSASLQTHATGTTGDHYRYHTTIESFHTRLVPLASYAVGPGGYFELSLDVTLTIDTIRADRGRVMLHLIVCDSDGVDKMMTLPTHGTGAPVSDAVPGYCAMANQTLDDLCESYPLTDDSPGDDYLYRSKMILAREWREDGQSYSGDGKLYVYVDACETVGGRDGVLRSCLARRDSLTTTAAASDGSSSTSLCFLCPKNSSPSTPPTSNSNCTTTPEIQPNLHIQAAMNLCNKEGSCLSTGAKYLTTFYLALAIAWASVWLIWATHIRASREAVIELQTKMKYVPMALTVYTVMMCAMLSTDQLLVGTARKIVVNSTILSQVFALAVPAEVIVLIAKGWKITRAHLDPREIQYIRFVTVAWAISYAVLRNSVVKHLTVFLIWGVSWSAVVFMVWYNSAFNLNMLLYQIAMVRQMQLDPVRTPVYTKYMLFRRFRGILAIYMFVCCVIAIVGLVSDTTNAHWRWTAVGAEEVASLLFYGALGYAFRCRRFSHLIQAPPSTTAAGTGAEEPTSPTTTTTAPATTTATGTGANDNPQGPTMGGNGSGTTGTPTTAQASSASVAPMVRMVPPPPIVRQKSAMVVFVNPNPQEQTLGTSYVPVNPKPLKRSLTVGPGGSAGGAGGGGGPGGGPANPKKDNTNS